MNSSVVATFWALVTILITGTQNITIRLAADHGADAFQIVLFRNLFALVSIVIILFWTTRSLPRSRFAALIAIACLVHVASTLSGYYGIAVLPLNESAALGFAMPLFATVGAALFLGETVRARRWSAVAAGLVGVLIILRPGIIPVSLGAAMVLLSAALGAVVTLMFKRFIGGEGAMTLVLWQSAYAFLFSVPPAVITWEMPTGFAAAMMITNGVLGTLGWLTFLRACQLTDASALMPFEFLRLPVVAVFAYVLFTEIPDQWVWIGAAVIFSSTLYIAHREAVVARESAGRRTSGEQP